MAEGGSDANSSSSYTNYYDMGDDNISDSSNSDIEDLLTSARPDLFNENVANCERKSSSGSLNPAPSDVPRREENPFSFKHFLNRDVSAGSTNYHPTGARPKVFTTSRYTQSADLPSSNSESGRMGSVDGVRAEFPSVLPDFVQDHLVVEQCYLGNDGNNVDIDNLPDFTLNRPTDNKVWSAEPSSTDSINDLTFNLLHRRRVRVGFPLGLPLVSDNHTDDSGTTSSGLRSCPQPGEVGVSKSLPDFLSDGPIHSNRLSNLTQTVNESPAPECPSPQRANRSPDNELLREELERTRQQLSDRNRRVEQLERDISAMQRKEQSYMDALAKSMEQVEGNLNSSNKRAISAENTVTKLKQEIKNLKTEMIHLRRENSSLKESGSGAFGGPSSSQVSGELPARRIAQDLRGAANTAEQSLRNLLTGLNNLRVIASSIENMHRIEEQQDHFLSDLEDEPGPAL